MMKSKKKRNKTIREINAELLNRTLFCTRCPLCSWIIWVWFTRRWSFIPSSSLWSWLNIVRRRILFLKATVLWPKVKPSLTQQSWSSPINTAAARHKYASAGVFRYSLLFKRPSNAVYRDHSKCNILPLMLFQTCRRLNHGFLLFPDMLLSVWR